MDHTYVSSGTQDKCVLCDVTVGRGRRNFAAKLRNKTVVTVGEVLQIIHQLQGPLEGYVCNECYVQLERQYRSFISNVRTDAEVTICTGQKREASPNSPRVQKKKTKSNKCSRSKKRTIIQSITAAVLKSNYHAAFSQIISAGKAAKIAFDSIVRKRVRRQIQAYTRNCEASQCFPHLTKASTVDNFSWPQVIKHLAEKLPTLYAAVTGSLDIGEDNPRASTLDPRTGLMMSVPLYTHNPVKFKFLQCITSIQMWRCGASSKLFKCLNKLGICQSSSMTRKLIDNLVIDADLFEWKREIEDDTKKQTYLHGDDLIADLILPEELEVDSEYVPISQELLESRPSTSSAVRRSRRRTRDKDESDAKDCDKDESDAKGCDKDESDAKGLGYSLIWDNTQKFVGKRDFNRSSKPEVLLWANAFAARNRVMYDYKYNSCELPASQIPLRSYLPCTEDYKSLKERMHVIVSRIVSHHIPYFTDHIGMFIQAHISHQHSTESALKSHLVNIGMIEANSSTTAGAIEIMTKLQKYVPRSYNGDLLAVPIHGNCLAVERMVDAKRATQCNLIDEERLEGLEPILQEFHHRGLMLQDTVNKLFSAKSIHERGTLSQLKNDFGHRKMSTDVMKSFNHVESFVRFATEAHVVYLMLHMCDMDDILDSPSGVSSLTDDEIPTYLLEMCEKVVDEVWMLPTIAAVMDVLDSDIDDKYVSDNWCICSEDRAGRMFRCSNLDCTLGTWFHESCVHIPSTLTDVDDWWCSEECRDTKKSPFCKCKLDKHGAKIRCANNACSNGTIFHMECMKLFQIPVGRWYCSENCASSDEEGPAPDGVRNYALSIIWYGLLDLCQRDTVREADGLAMMTMWRINMLRFWNGNHDDHLTAAHRLLAGISGWLNPRLIHEVVHNRTINLNGGLGKNVAMDRFCEFMSAEFKEIFRNASGRYVAKTVEHAGKIAGPLGRSVDAVFHATVCETELDGRHDYAADVKAFCKDYKTDKLFHVIPGRQHESFKEFVRVNKINEPRKLKERLVEYSKKIDNDRLH